MTKSHANMARSALNGMIACIKNNLEPAIVYLHGLAMDEVQEDRKAAPGRYENSEIEGIFKMQRH
jgi:predicted transcriptional regulator